MKVHATFTSPLSGEVEEDQLTIRIADNTIPGKAVPFKEVTSKIRYTTELANEKGEAFLVHLLGINDKKEIITINEMWAGENIGDVMYSGDFELGVQKIDSDTVYLQPYPIRNYDYNQTMDLAFKVGTQSIGQPDLLFLSEIEETIHRRADLFYMHGNTLKIAEEYGYYLRPKTIGHNLIQSVSYVRNEELGYFFVTTEFDPETGTFENKGRKFFVGDKLYDQGVEEVKKWQADPGYYVKTW
ncbi:hypothetical protein CSV80_05805 [Sporosarcina sp. P12(2017)]|uniref:hypothetical protein n=1 Tax=Sporosarcina sp. P10 TaxID=2048264 RepID=UPI000C164595|nr:hypothetical protein [Sporosarcina sp. P10]PIC58301.1 hypothetical protein CSV81_03925 [Sporosarcina sp. P10]PIC61534.1 hypothetical protein CSV80_05805 [Sporosarcina sp. P12(2017)]